MCVCARLATPGGESGSLRPEYPDRDGGRVPGEPPEVPGRLPAVGVGGAGALAAPRAEGVAGTATLARQLKKSEKVTESLALLIGH